MNRLSGRTSRLPRGQSSGSLSCKHKAAHRAAAPDLPVRRRRSGDCHRQGSASSAERGIYVAASSSAAAEASTSEGPVLEEGIDLNAKAEKSGLPRVLIAGGGIGGLVAAVALLKRGYPVQVFERDLTAIRGEGKYRGPIQVFLSLCNALAFQLLWFRRFHRKLTPAGTGNLWVHFARASVVVAVDVDPACSCCTFSMLILLWLFF